MRIVAMDEPAALEMERFQIGPKACRVAARGQIDLYSAPIFKTALVDAIDAGMIDIIVDLSDVEFMDSTALGVLVGISKRIKLLGGSVSIVSPDETIQRVFELAGLAKRFDIYDSEAAAVSRPRL